MATDRKADYVGDHGGRYTDINGMSKQFTYVDHDKKTKISTHNEPQGEATKAFRAHMEREIEAILAMPAVNAIRNPDLLYEEFVIRDMEKGVIWNEKVVRDACSINHTLRSNLFNQTWKATVRMQYWFEDMSYEDIIAGEWKKWT